MFKHGFPPEWSTLKKLIWLVGSGIAGAASGIWKTATGTLIHITDALASPMQKCEVTLEPIQDLHGQDAPYPAGGGSNKWNEEWEVGAYDPTTGNKISSSTQIRSKDKTPVIGGTSYCFVCVSARISQIYWYDANGDYLSNTSNQSSSAFVTSAPADASFVTFQTPSAYGTSYKNDIAVNYPSTVSTYSPHSNICPITGWTGCEVTRAGVNLLGALEDGYFPLFLPKGTIIVASCDNLDSTNKVTYYNKNKTQIDYWNLNNRSHETTRQFRSFTLTEDAYYFSFSHNDWNCQVEFGDTDSDYVAPSGTTASVTFPDTVYGGKVDVVSGNDYADWVAVVFDGVNKQLNVASTSYIGDTTTRGYFFNTSYKSIEGVSQITNFTKCSSAKPISGVQEQGVQSCYIRQGSAEINFRILNSLTGITSEDTTASAKTKLNAYLAQNPITFCYKLNEPIPFTTTPQEISTLKGENNVWSNSNGDTTIIYKAQAS